MATQALADAVLSEERNRLRELETLREIAKDELMAAKALQATRTADACLSNRRIAEQHTNLAVMIASICEEVHRRAHQETIAGLFEEYSHRKQYSSPPSLGRAKRERFTTDSTRVSRQTTTPGVPATLSATSVKVPNSSREIVRRYTSRDGTDRWPRPVQLLSSSPITVDDIATSTGGESVTMTSVPQRTVGVPEHPLDTSFDPASVALYDFLDDVIQDPNLDAAHLASLAKVLSSHATRRGPRVATRGTDDDCDAGAVSSRSGIRALDDLDNSWKPTAALDGQVDFFDPSSPRSPVASTTTARKRLASTPSHWRANSLTVEEDDDVVMIESALSRRPFVAYSSRHSPQRGGVYSPPDL